VHAYSVDTFIRELDRKSGTCEASPGWRDAGQPRIRVPLSERMWGSSYPTRAAAGSASSLLAHRKTRLNSLFRVHSPLSGSQPSPLEKRVPRCFCSSTASQACRSPPRAGPTRCSSTTSQRSFAQPTFSVSRSSRRPRRQGSFQRSRLARHLRGPAERSHSG